MNKYSNTYSISRAWSFRLEEEEEEEEEVIHPPSIFTYGPFLRRGRPGSGLRTWFSLYHSLDSSSPRDFTSVYYTNKYSNISSISRDHRFRLEAEEEEDVIQFGLYIHRPSLPTVHSYGGGSRGRFYSLGSLIITPLDSSSPRDFAPE